MLGVLVRLRLTMWRRALTQTSRLISTIFGALVALVVLVVFGGFLLFLGRFTLGAAAVSVVLFSVITFLWTLLGVAGAGVDLSLEPRRFSVLPVRPKELAAGILASAFIGIPAVFLLLLCIFSIIGWAGHGAGLAAAVAGLIGAPTTILIARIAVVGLAQAMTSRRGRDLAAVVMGVLGLLPMVTNLVLTTSGARSSLLAMDWSVPARVAGWLPIGWAWSLPHDVAAGRYAVAAVHLLLAVCLLGMLWRAWVRLIARELTAPLFTASVSRVRSGGLLARWAASGPAAAIAVRRLQAWGRDNRLRSMAVRTLLVPALLLVQRAVAGDGALPVDFPLAMLAILGGLTLMNDLAYDGSAWWLHLAADTNGRADRWGRIIATVVVFAPMLALVSAVVVLTKQSDAPLALLVTVISVFGAALALATIVGAIEPGVAPDPKANPFAGRSGGGFTTFVTTMLGLAIPGLVSLPVLLLAHLGDPSASRLMLALLIAVAQSLVLVVGSVWVAGRRLDSHGPEMLARLAAPRA